MLLLGPSTRVQAGVRVAFFRLTAMLGLLAAIVVAASPSTAHANPFRIGEGYRAPRLAPLLQPPGTVATPSASADPTADDDEGGSAPSQPKPLEVAPPSDKEPVLEKQRHIPPFFIKREYDTHTTRALYLPPLFIDRRPKPGHPEKFFHADLALTFGWYDKKLAKRRVINPVLLSFGSFSEKKTGWFSAPLLMGYKRVGDQFNFGQFPLVWWWGNRYVKNLLVIPFHYQQKTPEGFNAVSSLLVWYGHSGLDDGDPLNDKRHRVVAPIFWSFQRGLRRYNVGIPLYFGGRNEGKGLRHHSVFPLFHYQSREDGNQTEFWSLFYVDRRDRARQKRAWAIPPLVAFTDQRNNRKLSAFSPLVWRHEDLLRERVTWVVGPAGSRRDARASANWVAPLWWRFVDKKNQTSRTIAFPLVHVAKRPDQVRVDTPLLSVRRGEGRGNLGLGVHPLLTYAGGDGQGRNHQVVLGGTFWRFDNPKGDRRGVGVGPAFWWTEKGDRSSLGIPALLSFAGKRGPTNYQVVAGLFWHVGRKGPNPRQLFVAGPLYVDRQGKRWQAGLPPLYIGAGGEGPGWHVVPPLLYGRYSNKETGEVRTVSPWFVRAKRPGSDTLGVLGLYWDTKRDGGERDHVVFPFMYRRHRMVEGKKHILTVTPLGGAMRKGDDRTWIAGPVYGGRKDGRRNFGIVPLAFHQTRKDGVTTVVPGLFLRDKRPERDTLAISPLVWRSEVRGDKPRKNLALVPLYFRQRQPGGVDVDAGLGWFYSRDKHRQTHTIVAGTYFHRLTRTELRTGLMPITYWEDSPKRRMLLSLPGIFHIADKTNRSHTTIAVPFWFDRRQANGRRVWTVLPFVVGTKRRYNFTRVSTVPPGYVDIFRMSKNYRLTGYVPLLFRYQKCGFRDEDDPSCRYTLWGSVPLFLYGRDGQGRLTHGGLGLYLYDKDPGGTKFYTVLGGVNYRPKERLKWYALGHLMWRDTTRTHRTTAFVPFFYHRKHRSKDFSTTFVLPPVYIGQHRGDRKWFQTALLVWNFRTPSQVSTAVLPPLFFHQHKFAERRLTWVLPLFYRDNHWGKDKVTTWVFPALFGHSRKGTDVTAVQFPFLWHFVRGENQTTIGGPLWFDIKRGTKRTQVVPALYFGRETVQSKTRVIGPGLGWWTRDNEQSRFGPGLHWRVLLGLFGGGNQAGERYFSILGAKIKLEPKPLRESAQDKRNARREARQQARIEKRDRAFQRAQTMRNERIQAAAGF